MGDRVADRRAVHGPVHAGSVRLPGDHRSAGAARAWLAGLLADAGVHDECVDLAILVASELASNAVRHGSGDLLCHAVVDGDTCTLSVFDFGPGMPTPVAREPDTVGGLGLVIVGRLSRAWGVTVFEGGKAVYALVRADAANPPQEHGRALA